MLLAMGRPDASVARQASVALTEGQTRRVPITAHWVRTARLRVGQRRVCAWGRPTTACGRSGRMRYVTET